MRVLSTSIGDSGARFSLVLFANLGKLARRLLQRRFTTSFLEILNLLAAPSIKGT